VKSCRISQNQLNCLLPVWLLLMSVAHSSAQELEPGKRYPIRKQHSLQLTIHDSTSQHSLLLVHQNTDVQLRVKQASGESLLVQPGHEENSEWLLIEQGSGWHELEVVHRHAGAPDGEVWFEQVVVAASELQAWRDLSAVSRVYALDEKARALALIEDLLANHQVGGHQFIARALYMKAIMAYELGLHHYALHTFMTIHQGKQYISNYQQSYALAYTGRIHYLLTAYEASISAYQQANDLLDPETDRKAMASNHNNMGLSYHRRGLVREAREHYQLAGGIYQELGFVSMAARHHINMGGLHMLQGEFSQAEERFQAAMVTAGELNNPYILHDALEMQAWLKQTRGRWQSLLMDWEQILQFHEQQATKTGAIRANRLLGTVYNSLGAYRQALDHLKVAHGYKKLSFSLDTFRPFFAFKLQQVWQAMTGSELDKLAELQTDFERLQADLSGIKDQSLVLHQMAVAHHHLGNHSEAEQLLLQAFRHNQIQHNHYLAAQDALTMTEILLSQLKQPGHGRQLKQVRQTLDEWLSSADDLIMELGLPALRTRWYLLKASLLRLDKHWVEAGQVLQLAEQQATEQLDYASLFDIRLLRTELNLMTGGDTAAVQNQLIDLLQDGLDSRELVASPLLRSRFNTHLSDTSRLLITSLLNHHPSGSQEAAIQSLYWSEQLKAQSLRDLANASGHEVERPTAVSLTEQVEALKQLELARESFRQRGTNDEQQLLELNRQINHQRRAIERLLSEQPVKRNNQLQAQQWFSALQRRLQPGQLVVAVRELDDQLGVWLIDQHNIHGQLVPELSQIREQLTRVRGYFKTPRYGVVKRPVDVMRAISGLSQSLLGAWDLTPYKELVFSPHGSWQAFPINALRLDEHLAPLDMVLTPSLMLRDDAAKPQSNQQLLLVSQPAYRSDPSAPGLTALPHSAFEAEFLIELFGSMATKHLTAEQASKAALLQALAEPHTVAHLATHGLFNEQIPELTGLALAAEQYKHELLSISEIIAADIRADQVVLSACATGLGEAIIDEGMISVAYAFLAGGAREVYATLWPIGDHKAYQDVKSMYQRSAQTGEIQLTTSDPAWVKYKFL
jgi:CHAT domain-containing protein